MSKKEKNTLRYVCLTWTLISILLLFSMVPDASAKPRHGRSVAVHAGPRHGEVVYTLPKGCKTLWVGHKKYYHHRGTYYSRARTGFVVVSAPIGAFMASLPIGHMRVVIGGATYYHHDGIYYKRVPTGYTIVEPPPSRVVVIEEKAYKSEESLRKGDLVSVTERLLNVRSGPGKGFAVIQYVRRGETLEVHGYAPDWLYVRLPSGEYGWVMTQYTIQLHSGISG